MNRGKIKEYFVKLTVIFSIVLGWSFALRADEEPSATKIKASDITNESNIVPGADEIDDLITNNNLRALSGSLSRWSIASQFNYNGGTIDEPLSQDRPDISQASGTTTKADLDGAISAKYNINTRNSLMAGIGIRWIAPLSSNALNNYNGTTFDAMNPYLQYQYIYKWLGIQSVLQVQGMLWTQADQTALGYAEQLSLDQENMYEIGKTHLSFGVSSWGQYQWFNKSGAYSTPSDPNYIPDLSAVQSVYAFGFAPILEYQLTSKVNLRTLVNLFTFEHYGSYPNVSDLFHDQIYQSIGVGLSVTRDVFLYPNVQFLPGNIQSSLTNIGLAATVNVF